MTDPRFPIGRFQSAPSISAEERAALIRTIETCPADLRAAVAGLDDSQLDTPYRDGGWTLRQLVHHVADSHINVYVRFKLAMTEDSPEIRSYDQDSWAGTAESRSMPVSVSLDLMDGLHARWVGYLRTFQPEDWSRTLRHSEFDEPLTLDFLIQLYSWHGAHHVAHVTGLRARMGW